MFYLARNTLAVTGPMSKKAALKLWEEIKDQAVAIPGDKITLCRETGNMAVVDTVMKLN